jgi:hypothetical protein
MLGSHCVKVKAVFVRKEPLQTLDYMDLLQFHLLSRGLPYFRSVHEVGGAWGSIVVKALCY